MNLPDHNFLSAPLWIITALHITTFALHLLAMNFMVGGTVIVLYEKFICKSDDDVYRKLIKLFPTVMAATVSFGVAPLLFLQLVYGQYVYSASIVSAWFWLMIVAVVIICYYSLYAAAFAEEDSGRTRIYLTVALCCFVYVSFTYSSVFSMAEQPALYKALYIKQQSGSIINPAIGSYIFRWLHFLTAALAVGGFFTGWLGKDNKAVFEKSIKYFMSGIVAAMITGTAYLFSLGSLLKPVMNSYAAPVLLAAIILSIAALFYFVRKDFIKAGVIFLVSFTGMIIIRFHARTVFLKDYFDPSTIPVKPQWTFFMIFIICFAIAAILVWYMLKLFFAKNRQ